MLALELAQGQGQRLVGGSLQQCVGKGELVPHGHAVVQLAKVDRPDLDRGKMMEKKLRYLLQPSISADSSISLGMVDIKAVWINTDMGKAKVT